MLSNVYVGVYFACADDGIGRFDRSMLSQQDLMELFIFGLDEPEKICGNRDDPDDVCEWTGVICNGDGEVEKFEWTNKHEDGTGTLVLEFLPWSMKLFRVCSNALSADPMDGHLYVVGRTSTQSLGKPGATRYYLDPPGWHRVSARAVVIHHCCGIPASVAAKKQKLSPQSARMRAVRAINLIALLLRAGDVHPNPGPSLHVAQFNVLGFPPGKKISLLHKAKMLALDVVLLQELHVTEDKACRLAIPGFHCFAVARDAKGRGVAVLVRDALQCSLTSQSVSEVVEHTTVCVKVGDELSYFTSAYFPRGHKVSAAALSRLSQDDRRTHIIGADTNCHHEDWDRYVAPNPGGTYVVDFCP